MLLPESLTFGNCLDLFFCKQVKVLCIKIFLGNTAGGENDL